ncbi:pyridoxal phosphate-dependent aminotransferase [Candidatus Micrarchaeota archaeon]|nr:pyridoxal phosphate-dependent aminotransferase [Candidatus Micrarchaeota archaeon]MBU1166307.1 pyridoxal phosphate-dependent aminotransferase [Candidatus Micrarchaeota archaeon]MBU1886383.1 pyridoxal phosphate-dependent aminotransferase [Candidatus Micrarchaeota archaeon]
MSFYDLAEKALKLEREGKKIIRLNVGDTNMPTPQCVLDAAIDNLNEKKTDYGSSAGLPELREKIAKREGCGIENVVIGPGSKHILYGLLTVLAKKGEKVTIPTPAWPAYEMICKQLGLETVMVRTEMENNWHFETLDLKNSKMCIICNPANPTSNVYSQKCIDDVIKNAKEKECHLILDEAYKAIAFEKIPRYEGAIRVRSFSKEFNIANWRLGYAIAPADVAKKLIAYNQINITCVPPFVQMGGIACLENEKELITENLKVWKARSKAAQKALKNAGFEFVTPDAGIYVFATHEKITHAGEYAHKLLDNGVAIAPGGVFGGYERHFRICINQDEETLEDAVGIMTEEL